MIKRAGRNGRPTQALENTSMSKIDTCTTIEHQVFSILALCYYPPDADVGERLGMLEQTLAPMGGEFHDLAENQIGRASCRERV